MKSYTIQHFTDR